MKNPIALGLSLLLLLVVASVLLPGKQNQSFPRTTGETDNTEPEPATSTAVVPAQDAGSKATALSRVIAPLPENNAAALAADALSLQTVFRMVLNNGKCRLDAVEEVSGDFRPRRNQPELHPGMLLCRLVSGKGTVLAEKPVHVPDHVCRVLDSDSTPEEPIISLFSGVGPQVFQVRFPAHLPGKKLEVYRVTRTRPVIGHSLLLTLPVNS